MISETRTATNPSCQGRAAQWNCRGTILSAGPAPLIMGILNATPDSFSDGGKFLNQKKAVEHGLQMMRDGADIVDVGGESSRPGACEITADEECARIIPIIKELSIAGKALISVDTIKAIVAHKALEAGASIINDISAMTLDPAMPDAAATTGAGIILMHMRGNPRTMQDAPHYNNVSDEVAAYLRQRIEAMLSKGVKHDTIAIDPGTGFGKTTDHNVKLLADTDRFAQMGAPLVVGLSRKSFLGQLTGKNVQDRLAATLAGVVFCALKGVHVLRVHDVAASLDAVRVACALNNGKTNAV